MALSFYVPLTDKNITMPDLYHMLNLLDMGIHETKTTQQVSELWHHLSDICEDFHVSKSSSQYYDIQHYLDRCNSEKWTELFAKIDKKFITKRNEHLVLLRYSHEASVLFEKNLITPDLIKETFIRFINNKIGKLVTPGVFLFQEMRDRNLYQPDEIDSIIEYAEKGKNFDFLVNLTSHVNYAYLTYDISEFLKKKSKDELIMLAENRVENYEDMKNLLGCILYQSPHKAPNKNQELSDSIKRMLDKDSTKGQLFDKVIIRDIMSRSKYDFFSYPLYAYLSAEAKEKVKEYYTEEAIEYEKNLLNNEIASIAKKNEIRRI